MVKEIVELLRKEGFVDKLQMSINAAYVIMKRDVKTLSEESQKECQLSASKHCLKKFMADREDEDELLDKFFELATDLAAEAIFKELDLKPDENYKPDKSDKLVAILALLESMKEDK